MRIKILNLTSNIFYETPVLRAVVVSKSIERRIVMKKVPFVKAKVTGKVLVECQGETVFNSDINLSLTITEDNAAQVIESVTPQIMAIATQISEVISTKLNNHQ